MNGNGSSNGNKRATPMARSADLDVAVLFPTKFLKCEDLKGKHVTVTITSGKVEEVPMTNGKKENKVVFTMAGTQKLWIVGKTNALAMSILLSSSNKLIDAIGKRVTLCPDITTYGREEMPCVRVFGSPDALPGRADIYARAWKGNRKSGTEFAGRLKHGLAQALLNRDDVPPVAEPEDIEEGVGHDPDDMFADSAPNPDVGGDDATSPTTGAVPS